MTWRTLTAAAAYVVDDGRLLLVRQRRPSGVWWEPPAGYAEPNETLEECAARETLEEAGLAIEIGPLICLLMWEWAARERRNLVACFAATPTGDVRAVRPQVEEGIDAVDWFTMDTIDLSTVHPLERAVLERWRPGVPATGFFLVADVVDDPPGYQFRPRRP